MKEKSILISAEIHQQFKVVCAQNNVLMKSVLEKLMTQFINEKSVENKPNTSNL
jgi:hypothetical protein